MRVTLPRRWLPPRRGGPNPPEKRVPAPAVTLLHEWLPPGLGPAGRVGSSHASVCGRREPAAPALSRRGALLFAAMCVIWGIPYLMIRVAVRELAPVTLVFLRTGLAALLLVPLAAQRRELRPLLPRWRPLLAYPGSEGGPPWVLLSPPPTKPAR